MSFRNWAQQNHLPINPLSPSVLVGPFEKFFVGHAGRGRRSWGHGRRGSLNFKVLRHRLSPCLQLKRTVENHFTPTSKLRPIMISLARSKSLINRYSLGRGLGERVRSLAMEKGGKKS